MRAALRRKIEERRTTSSAFGSSRLRFDPLIEQIVREVLAEEALKRTNGPERVRL